jgi:Aspartyl/Asparaginyl beta-hydroxylase
MDLGKPLTQYGPVDISELRKKMSTLPASYWEMDRAARVAIAGNRPGNAVYFYNDLPAFARRDVLAEARSGVVRVFRQANRPLFREIDNLIQSHVQPLFPECKVMKVQLAELPPSGVIPPHRDGNILASVHRLHVPLVTHKNVKFLIGDQVFFLAEGVLYDLNNVVLHSVKNESDVMRVHLLIDMLPASVANARYFDTEAEFLSGVAA